MTYDLTLGYVSPTFIRSQEHMRAPCDLYLTDKEGRGYALFFKMKFRNPIPIDWALDDNEIFADQVIHMVGDLYPLREIGKESPHIGFNIRIWPPENENPEKFPVDELLQEFSVYPGVAENFISKSVKEIKRVFGIITIDP